jgi:signal transduction histidine kinase
LFSVTIIVTVFAATFLPMKVRALSMVYPGALVMTGVTLMALLGPRIDAFLVLAGGMFVGSLVMTTRGLLLITFVGAVGALIAGYVTYKPADGEVWSSAIVTMIAVAVPAAVTGRVLVAALARALGERQGLVDEVMAEREALQATIRDLETTRTQLTHAQKVELMSQLAGGIAHDMNNALTAIIGEASLLDDAVSEERERILEAGEYAAKLTHQLMVFARRDTSQPKPIDIVATLNGLLRAVRRVIPSDISL